MTKIVTNIVEKALEKGEATVNGRMSGSYGYRGPLEEKYGATVKGNFFHFRHWGTETVKIDMDKKEVIEWYGEGVSDRDSLNCVLALLGVGGCFRYRPVNGGFTYEK